MGDATKVLICGDGAIGKTCLISTFCGQIGSIDWDAPVYKPTSAANSEVELETYDESFGATIKLWDTAGQEALKSLRKAAYPSTEILLLGFDMTSEVSLNNLPAWIEEFEEATEEAGGAKAIIVVGTKSDMYSEFKDAGKDVVDFKKMFDVACQIGAHRLVMTSAKTGAGVMHPDLADDD